MLPWIHLSCNGVKPQISVYGTHEAIRIFLVMSGFSLLLGSIFSITSGILCGVIQVLQYHTTHGEKYAGTASDHCGLCYTIYWRGGLLMQRWLVSHGIWNEYLQQWVHPVAARGGYKNIIVVQYVVQLISCNSDLILLLYICLYFSWLQNVPSTVYKYLWI